MEEFFATIPKMRTTPLSRVRGIVTMPFQQTFCVLRFGALVDQFGVPWSGNCEKSTEAAD